MPSLSHVRPPQTWRRCIGGPDPVTILTDQDLAMVQAISTTLPNSKHALCLWHIMQKFPSYFRSILQDRYGTFLTDFYGCMELETVEQFEVAFPAMVDKYGLADNRHLRGLYGIRHMWAAPFLRGFFFAGMRTTQRSESYNALLKGFMGSSTTLNAFFTHVS